MDIVEKLSLCSFSGSLTQVPIHKPHLSLLFARNFPPPRVEMLPKANPDLKCRTAWPWSYRLWTILESAFSGNFIPPYLRPQAAEKIQRLHTVWPFWQFEIFPPVRQESWKIEWENQTSKNILLLPHLYQHVFCMREPRSKPMSPICIYTSRKAQVLKLQIKDNNFKQANLMHYG